MGDYSKLPTVVRWRWRMETSKQMGNIWAMLAVASYAAALFQGRWILGLLLGMASTKMAIDCALMKAQAETELEKWKSSQPKQILSSDSSEHS